MIVGVSVPLETKPSTRNIVLFLPVAPSREEAESYYAGISSPGSCPILVARSSTTPWKPNTDPYRVKQLRPVGKHPPLTDVWADKLGPKVADLLDSMKVILNVVGMGEGDYWFAPVVLWIGVKPDSLSGDDGTVAARKCWDLLGEYDITDVDVEIHESVVVRL